MSIFALLGIAVHAVSATPCVGSQSSLDRPLDYMPLAGGTAALVRELADKSGLKLEADLSVHQDFMAIAAAGATPRVIMKQMASALGAEWKEVDGVTRLLRTPAQAAEERKRQVDMLVPKLTAFLEPYLRPVGPLQDPEALKDVGRGADHVEFAVATPLGRFLSRTIQRLGVRTIAELESGKTVVYAYHPTAFQRPYPKGIDEDWALLMKEQTGYSARANKVITDAMRPAWLTEISPDERILLVVRSYGSMVQMSVQSQWPDGKARFGRQLWGATINPMSSRLDPVFADAPLELRPESAELWVAGREARAGGMPAITEKIRPFLEKPFDNEPLSLGNTEAIQQISRAAGKPVLAVLSDGSLYGMGMEKPTLLAYERRNLGNRQVVDGWLVYTTPDPLAVRSGRIDRRVVQAMFSRAKDANPLDAIARAAVEHKTPIEGTHFAQYLRLAGVGHIAMNQELLRLYGALTNAERQALRDGPVKVGALAAAFNEAKNALMRDRTLRTFDAGQGRADGTYGGGVS